MPELKWLEFRVEEKCPHAQDIYDGCPLCRVTELEEFIAKASIIDYPYEYQQLLDEVCANVKARERRSSEG